MFWASLPVYEIAALGTAVSWALTSMISSVPAGYLGAIAFSRLRQVSIAVLLAFIVFTTGRWQSMSVPELGLLIASGVFGIFLGDSLLFTTLNRLGPRRSGILFALNAPMTALLGFVFLGETLSWQANFGIGLCVAGVMLAIFFGKGDRNTHSFEHVKGSLAAAIALGLGAALSQAIGSTIVRPLMASGLDPLVASMVRIGVASVCLSALLWVPLPQLQQRNPMTLRIAALTILTGILAMGIGATLLMFAFSGGKAGIVSTLSATSPAMVLPMLWFVTKQRPAAGAWLGAGLVIVGMALIFVRA
jgi:drug/metabolite transporter (DMT)-like permease